jgi:hypothetical protein
MVVVFSGFLDKSFNLRESMRAPGKLSDPKAKCVLATNGSRDGFSTNEGTLTG